MCFILGKTLRMVETENGKFQSCAEFNKFLCSWTEVVHWNVLPEALCPLLWHGAGCRDELPNIGLLLTLSNFLTAAFFVQWVRKLWGSFQALPLSRPCNAVWICYSICGFCRNSNHVGVTSCKSVLNLGSLRDFAHVFEVYCSEMIHHLIFL